VIRWPRKTFLCRTHAAEHFKAKRRADLARLRERYGDMEARAAQSDAHHLALRADTLGRITDPGVHTTTSVLLASALLVRVGCRGVPGVRLCARTVPSCGPQGAGRHQARARASG